MKLILLGKPGAGKGTQAQKLAEEEDYEIISTGDIIREEIKKESHIGQKIKNYVSKGELVPDEIVVDLVVSKLKNNKIIFDGFPRTIKQAEFLEKKLGTDKVIFLHVDDEVVINRIKNRITVLKNGKTISFQNQEQAQEFISQNGGEIIKRQDDDEQTIKNRLKVYQENTKELIKYYKALGKFESVNSDKPIQEVHNDILKAIHKS